jgi:hypothetical protein
VTAHAPLNACVVPEGWSSKPRSRTPLSLDGYGLPARRYGRVRVAAVRFGMVVGCARQGHAVARPITASG